MEIEIEDLHIQMEDVVKTKLSVSFGILLPDAPTSIIPQFPPQHALVFKSVVCVCVFPYSQKQLGLNPGTCFYLKGNYSHAVSTKTTKKCLINAAVMPYLHSSECSRTRKLIFTHHQTVNGYYNNKCPLACIQFRYFRLMDEYTSFFPLYLLINDSVS